MKHILEDARFQAQLEKIAATNERPLTEIQAEAAEYLEELNTVHQPVANLLGIQFIQYILSRGYDKNIDINPDELRQLAKVARQYPVAFVMTHKTYIDMLVLAIVLVRHGLPIPHIFAGINMDFMGVGQFGRQNGVIFIRRDIKDNAVYKAALRQFIAYRVSQKSDFMWAIEGTRSRTGKLVWPKMGLLKYIKEAEQYSGQEVKYVPVSIVYDLIPDVEDMTLESRGKQKSPESLMWFIDYIRKLGDKFGKISLRVGEPVSMQEDDDVATQIYQSPNDQRAIAGEPISRFALELVYRINKITPVTTTSLVCAALISEFSLTKRQLESNVAVIMQLIEDNKSDALVDRGTQLGTSIQQALNLLQRAQIIEQKGDNLRTKYTINSDQFLQATYYANMSVHYLYHQAFVELALLKIEEQTEHRSFHFWDEVMRLRQLFKFEFFYSQKLKFTEEVESSLAFMSPKWRQIISEPTTNIPAFLGKQKILVAPVVLYAYIDAYRVVVQALRNHVPGAPFERKAFLKTCILLGEEMHWQGRIQRLESVSKPFLQNGLRFAEHQQLIPRPGYKPLKAITETAAVLDDVANRIRRLQELTLQKPKELVPYVPVEREVVPGSRTESVAMHILNTAEEGAQVGAFFDLDRTLIRGFSAKQFVQSRLLSGRFSTRELLSQFSGVLVYARGNANFAGLAAISAKGVRGVDEQIFVQTGEEVYFKHLAHTIYPEARALVAAHLAKGHTVAIISAATPYQVNPIARDLGIDHVMCTRLEVEKGKFTGNIVEPACWGEGKVYAAEQLAEQHKLDLQKSYFYTDSVEDLALLEMVGNPRPMNPDAKLAALAYKNAWPVYRFNEDAPTGISELARTGLAVGSLFPAVVRALIDGASNLSWQEGINALIANTGDLVIAMSGIELVVRGEANLWDNRPAVFMFNHQSGVDLFIAAKLIRKDVVGIAKKELQRVPILGQMMSAAGVIFIDRKNRQKAIEALQPAVKALQSGLSVVIFPEGTRSKSYRLGQFKKGGFHLAVQAGVPIIPVVVRNAYDAMPKGTTLLKSVAIEVVVHPAIPTTDWELEDMGKHIREVRQVFLDELGQKEKGKKKAEV
jgi:putative phosphoserine phosphatase/1-acylglycerol-3-phosphate O-acyltransferase